MNDDNAWDGFFRLHELQPSFGQYLHVLRNEQLDQGPSLEAAFNYNATMQNVIQMEAEAKKAGLLTPTRIHRWVSFFRAYITT